MRDGRAGVSVNALHRSNHHFAIVEALILILYPLTGLAVVGILVAAAWRAMRALERIAATADRVEALLRDHTGRAG